MAYDEGLAVRVRDLLSEVGPMVTEKKMFGGLSFLVAGNMCCGIIGKELVARVGKDAAPAALAEPGARVLDFTGRPMKGWISVAPEALTDDALAGWVRRSLDFVERLAQK